MRSTRAWPMVLVLLLAGGLLVQAGDDDPGHPDVDLDLTCAGCHAQVTPDVFRQWYASPHGRNNVKCFVCHGAVGENFMLSPTEQRCVGCHAEQVGGDGEAGEETLPCVQCHPAHLLSPHLELPEGGTP